MYLELNKSLRMHLLILIHFVFSFQAWAGTMYFQAYRFTFPNVAPLVGVVLVPSKTAHPYAIDKSGSFVRLEENSPLLEQNSTIAAEVLRAVSDLSLERIESFGFTSDKRSETWDPVFDLEMQNLDNGIYPTAVIIEERVWNKWIEARANGTDKDDDDSYLETSAIVATLSLDLTTVRKPAFIRLGRNFIPDTEFDVRSQLFHRLYASFGIDANYTEIPYLSAFSGNTQTKPNFQVALGLYLASVTRAFQDIAEWKFFDGHGLKLEPIESDPPSLLQPQEYNVLEFFGLLKTLVLMHELHNLKDQHVQKEKLAWLLKKMALRPAVTEAPKEAIDFIAHRLRISKGEDVQNALSSFTNPDQGMFRVFPREYLLQFSAASRSEKIRQPSLSRFAQNNLHLPKPVAIFHEDGTESSPHINSAFHLVSHQEMIASTVAIATDSRQPFSLHHIVSTELKPEHSCVQLFTDLEDYVLKHISKN